MIHSDDIKRVAFLCSRDKSVAYEINESNGYEILKFFYYQLKYNTCSTFHTIYFNRKKDLLYYFLISLSKISLGRYKVVYIFD